MNRLEHDTAFRIARRCLSAVRPRLTADQAGDAFAEFYTLARQGLVEYAEAAARQHQGVELGAADVLRE